MTALFEVDKQKLLERIDQAESAVVLRTRELFTDFGSHQQERRALEAALCALRALRSITQHQTRHRRRELWLYDPEFESRPRIEIPKRCPRRLMETQRTTTAGGISPSKPLMKRIRRDLLNW